MLDILYEDKDILVVVKPAGVESQTSRRLEPDMVSEIKNYPPPEGAGDEKVIHRIIPKSVHSPGGSVCWSYPPTGQAGARCDGICQEPQAAAHKPSGTGGKTGENLSGTRMWKTCG